MNEFVILNAEPEDYSPLARQILESIGSVEEGVSSREELLSTIPEVDVLIVRLGYMVDQEILDKAKKLKAVVTATTGLNHVDLEYAASRGIEVLSLRGEVDFLRSIPATAELTWGLLLSLTRNIPDAVASVRSGEWSRNAYRGYDLYQRRLGILGLGRIGEIVARYGMAFGMRVMAYDPYRAGWQDGVERYTELDTFLEELDVLSIHIPYSPENDTFIGANQLESLKESAVLINTSRGGVLDEKALLEVLQSRKIRGAGLDVLSAEHSSKLSESKLLEYSKTHSNLLITPHIGGASFDSMAATEVFMAEKLKRFLNK